MEDQKLAWHRKSESSVISGKDCYLFIPNNLKERCTRSLRSKSRLILKDQRCSTADLETSKYSTSEMDIINFLKSLAKEHNGVTHFTPTKTFFSGDGFPLRQNKLKVKEILSASSLSLYKLTSDFFLNYPIKSPCIFWSFMG